MKKILVYTPIVLSVVILGAHFLREGNSIGVIGPVILVALLLVRQPWVARLMQAVLVMGTLEWLITIHHLVTARAAHGQPYARLVVILGVVAAVTFGAALLFQSSTMKQIYQLGGRK